MKSARNLITICLLFTAATLFAQTESQWLMKVHIPYSFTVANQPMPAGIYNFYTVGSQRVVRITNVDGKHTATVSTLLNYSNSAASAAHLVFDEYGSEYFLSQIWSGGDDLSRNPTPSKRARELAGAGAELHTATIPVSTSGR
jgi:hypothetical protein